MGRGRNSDWFWRTVATARPSTGHAWLRDPDATAHQVAGAAGRAAKLSADWKERQRAAGIVSGRSYGRWDEHGSWIRGDPDKRRPFSGADDAAAGASSALPDDERLTRSGAEAAVEAYVRCALARGREHPITSADLQRVCPRRPPPDHRAELIETIFESAELAQAIAAAEEAASLPCVASRKQLAAQTRAEVETVGDAAGPAAAKRPRRSTRIAAR